MWTLSRTFGDMAPSSIPQASAQRNGGIRLEFTVILKLGIKTYKTTYHIHHIHTLHYTTLHYITLHYITYTHTCIHIYTKYVIFCVWTLFFLCLNVGYITRWYRLDIELDQAKMCIYMPFWWECAFEHWVPHHFWPGRKREQYHSMVDQVRATSISLGLKTWCDLWQSPGLVVVAISQPLEENTLPGGGGAIGVATKKRMTRGIIPFVGMILPTAVSNLAVIRAQQISNWLGRHISAPLLGSGNGTT